jgi:tetratricopeptide (TPR) repeat protein
MVLLALCAGPGHLAAQPPGADSRRAQAAELFDQGRRLDALPLLEELVGPDSRDDQMLVALAACLIDHAATLPDEAAAGKERLLARDLLARARDLGNRSTLALNLSELLAGMPSNGALRFSDNPGAEQAIRDGEAAFSHRDFKTAIQHYSRALALDPKSYTAALFIANSYDRDGDPAQGALWYERAIHLDPDTETAYRYYADMLARQGAMDRARALLIQAAVAEPYNRMVWRELRAWATVNGTHLNEIFIAVPAPPASQPPGFQQPPQIAAVWKAYRDIIARWQDAGPEFRKRFPDEKKYRHSLQQEADALIEAASGLEKLAQDPATAALVTSDANASLLLSLHAAGMIAPYVLFSLGDHGIAQDYAAYRAAHRDRLEAYLNQLVVPPTPAPTTATH